MSQVKNTPPKGGIDQKRHNGQSAIPLFAGILISVLLLIYLTSTIIYSQQKKGVRSHYKQVISSQISATHKIMNHELNSILIDCLFLIEYPVLLNYLEQPSASNRQLLNDTWSNFSNQKLIYDQVRYIDESGKEIIRINNINGKAVVTPLDQLQMKSGRYYFKQSLSLNKNEIYLSPLDLNIERGKIETPHKPTIRIAIPIFDRHGEKRGVITLNYLAKRLFEIIDNPKNQQQGQNLLVNTRGFYLRGRERTDEWGFMFGHKGALKTMAYDFPRAWEEIKIEPRGVVDNESGIFIYEQIEFPASNSKLKSHTQQHWKLINYTSNDTLLTLVSPLLHKIWIVAITTLLLLLPLIWVFSNHLFHKKLAQQKLRTNEHYLRLILSSTAEGVIGVDQKGQTTFVNMAAQKMVQYSQDELIGKHIHDWIFHDDESSTSHLIAQCQITRCLKSGVHHQVKIEAFNRKDGSHFPIECQATPLVEEGGFQGAVITFRDITDRLKTEQALQHKASFDRLTGIYNRLKFEELLEQAILESNRYKRPLSLAMFDIDHFKLINDAHGHQVGDEVLKEVAKLAKMTLRDVDSLARWGGEEFMILAPETTLEGMTNIAEKVRNTIACHPFSIAKRVTVSFGVAQFKEREAENEFLKRTDDALYIAKQLGRNRVERSE